MDATCSGDRDGNRPANLYSRSTKMAQERGRRTMWELLQWLRSVVDGDLHLLPVEVSQSAKIGGDLDTGNAATDDRNAQYIADRGLPGLLDATPQLDKRTYRFHRIDDLPLHRQRRRPTSEIEREEIEGQSLPIVEQDLPSVPIKPDHGTMAKHSAGAGHESGYVDVILVWADETGEHCRRHTRVPEVILCHDRDVGPQPNERGDVLQEMKVGMASPDKHDTFVHRCGRPSASATADLAMLRSRSSSPPARASTRKAMTVDSISLAVDRSLPGD